MNVDTNERKPMRIWACKMRTAHRRILLTPLAAGLLLGQTSCHKVCDCDEAFASDTATLKLVDETTPETMMNAVFLQIRFKTHLIADDEFKIESGYTDPTSVKTRGPVKGTYQLDGDRIRFQFTPPDDGFHKLIDPNVTYFLDCRGKEIRIRGGGRTLTFECVKQI